MWLFTRRVTGCRDTHFRAGIALSRGIWQQAQATDKAVCTAQPEDKCDAGSIAEKVRGFSLKPEHRPKT
jgi:hypothetical protein